MLGLASLFGMLFLGAFAEGAMAAFKGPVSDAQDDDGDTAGGVLGVGGAADQAGDLLADDGPGSDDTPDERDADLTVYGDDDIDVLAGKGGNDGLFGGGGDDLIDGRDGDDRLDGGDGRDALHGGRGNDVLLGAAGDDDLHGEDGDDRLAGGEGDDLLCGHEGADGLAGGSGEDTLIGGGGDDDLTGEDGDDTLTGGFGDDLLDGGLGLDLLQGGSGNDTLLGGDGPGLQALDYLNGGDGDDTFVLDALDAAFGGAGADQFGLGLGADRATISDFNGDEDRILVEYDPVAHPEPDLSVEIDPEDAGSALILLDGLVLAHVIGGAGMTVADITLQPIAA